MRIFLLNTKLLTLLLLLACMFDEQICFAQNATVEEQVSLTNEKSDTDLTAVRALEFIGEKPSEEWGQYKAMRDAFVKSASREDLMTFNRWQSGITPPILIESWEQEWKDHPESHPAFLLYIRDDIKKTQLSLKLADNDDDLFNSYLGIKKKFAEKMSKECVSLEKNLNIPKELKDLARNPKVYSDVGMVYSHYLTVKNVQKIVEHRKKEDAVAIAARRAIVPVERGSTKYNDAFQDYKNADAKLNQVLGEIAVIDPAWVRAKTLIETGEVGTAGFTGYIEEDFLKNLNEKDKQKYHLWSQGFCIQISIDTVTSEWKSAKDSHRAINFYLLALQKRIRDVSAKTKSVPINDYIESVRGKLDDETNLNPAIDILTKQYAEALSNQTSLEKELNIPSKLKKAVERHQSDSTLFTIYDTYLRLFQPVEFSIAEKELDQCIDKLNMLRPNWSVEEKIVFPDKFSWKMHQLGLDKKTPMSSTRIILCTLGIILIIVFIVFKIRTTKNKK